MNLSEDLLQLKIKKARQFLEIESLSTVNDSVYTNFGKTVAEIMKKEKQLLQENNDDLT